MAEHNNLTVPIIALFTRLNAIKKRDDLSPESFGLTQKTLITLAKKPLQN
jgi:hypothetical protein